MSLRKYYPDGSLLAVIPPNAIKVIHDRHKSTRPTCLCAQCKQYNTNPDYYENIMKEYTPEAIKKKKEILWRTFIENKYGSIQNYQAEQKRKVQMSRDIIDASNHDWSMTAENLAKHTNIKLLERMHDDLMEKSKSNKSDQNKKKRSEHNQEKNSNKKSRRKKKKRKLTEMQNEDNTSDDDVTYENKDHGSVLKKLKLSCSTQKKK
eukprot:897533_1